MPDRIIRDELLESERWLSLKDNADRLAYLALLLKADAHGNFDGGEYRLMRLWRDFGIGTPALVAKTLSELVDHDLIRLYEVESKRFIHVPRYRQSLRYPTHVVPASPWDDGEQKQRVTKKSQCEHIESAGGSQGAHSRSEEKRSEEKRTKAIRAVPSEPPPGFVSFWQTYRSEHRKVDKAKCLAYWRKQGLEVIADEIVRHVAAMCQTQKWREGYEPAPLRYLTGRRWDDGVPEQQREARRVSL